jgi:Osmosensitive K+ channel histidine kinase
MKGKTMKIKTQAYILIIGMIGMIASVIALSFFYEWRENARAEKDYLHLMEAYDRARARNDWKVLQKNPLVKETPIAIIDQNKIVVYSTIPGLQLGEDFKLRFWDFISNDEFEYSLMYPHDNKNDGYLCLIRYTWEDSSDTYIQDFMIKLFLGAFISVLVFAAIMLSIMVNAIMKSVLALDKAAQRIVSGSLENPVAVQGNDEICSLVNSLNAIRMDIKARNEQRSRFMMGISHDLKTPIALIRGYAAAIEAGLEENPEEQSAHLDIIIDKSEQLDGMIDDLINFAAVDTGAWQTSFRPMRLLDWLMSFTERSKADADLLSKQIYDRISLPPNTIVLMDERLFERALDNLVHNALRYTSENGKILITAFKTGNEIKIEIIDNGKGINPDDLPHIFDLFYRGSSSRREPGMGMGLAIAQTVVNLHGWNIQASSEPGQGSTFTITIPQN